MSLQLVFKAVFLLLLTSTAQSASCATAPDETTTYTCGIEWTLTLSSSITLTRAKGTMVTSGQSTGILETPLT